MYLYLSRDGADPADLRVAGRDELASYPTVSVDRGAGALVVEAAPADRGFRVRTAGGRELSAAALVLTGGQVHRLPAGVDGLAQRWGTSVFHCPFCHGWEARDKPLVVLGGAAEQARTALHLRSRISDDVVLCTDGPARLPDGPCRCRRLRGGGPPPCSRGQG